MKAAVRGRGRGPWTVQVSLRDEDEGTREVVVVEVLVGGIS